MNLTVLWWRIKVTALLILFLWCLAVFFTTLCWCFFPESIDRMPKAYVVAVSASVALASIYAGVVQLREVFTENDSSEPS